MRQSRRDEYQQAYNVRRLFALATARKQHRGRGGPALRNAGVRHRPQAGTHRRSAEKTF